MADCDSNKIDSNVTGLAIAEEECLKQLPGVDGADAVWYAQEPNSYSDFGGEITTVARAPISQSRQNKKGATTDLDASGGFNTDVTKSNMTRILQGFFFADAREPSSTKPINGAPIVITGVIAADKKYTAASGLASFAAGQLVYCTGFTNATNNGLKTVVTSAAGFITVAEVCVDETPTAEAAFERVGGSLTTADISIAVTSGIPALISTTTDFTTFPGLIPGKWIFLGGDQVAARFSNNVGYARIKSIAAHSIIFDSTTWSPVTEAGTGKTIQFFAGAIIKNENVASLIKRRSYNIERQLGIGEFGEVQAEYLEGAVANEFTLNIPQADKLNADLSFVACDNTQRSGDTGDEIKAGTRISAKGEDAFNTSSDIYSIKLTIADNTTSAPSPLFGYLQDASISINNNVTPNKALGVLGAFDTSAGNFDVGGSITAYFTTTAAVKAVRNNANVGLYAILAARNSGFIYDIPLLSLGGGRISVEKDNPITVPVEPAGAENEFGYTMMYCTFSYLPNVAMPS